MNKRGWFALWVLLTLGLCSSTTCLLAQGAQAVVPPVADEVGPLLTLSEVLASVQAHHPLLRAEIEAVQAALGGEQQARGRYDPYLQVKGSAGPAGYYDYNILDASISQLTPLWGAELYAGYRLQGQKLPDYYGELETLDRGEVRAGLRIPLWKDRAIDDARAGRRRAEAGKRSAEWQREATLLELYRGAATAYYDWTAALLDRQVQADLLALAQQRVDQVQWKVKQGALPPIEALDNQRALLSRETKLVEAQRKLEQAELKLALYLRDQGGQLRRPRGVSPEPLELPGLPPQFDEVAMIDRALDTHPLLSVYEADLQALRVDLELADNGVAPDLAVAGEVSKDIGNSDNVRSLQPTALRLTATIKVPLALREARGKRHAAAAKLRALQAKAEYARDKQRVEALNQASALRNAIERATRTKQMAEVAEQLAEGERSRFELGATTLIWVTTREKTAADARIDAIHAIADARVALAAYRTALAQKP